MDSSTFDLNIQNYTIKELEEVIELPDNYDESIIELQVTKLRNNISMDKGILETTKIKTLNFVDNAEEVLKKHFNKQTPLTNGITKLNETYEKIYHLDNGLKKSELMNDGDTTIIKRPANSYGESMPSEFHEGVINPLKKRILRQNINIDTRFRENYYVTTSSNFNVDLPIKLSNVVSLQLSAFEFPNTLYVISHVFSNNFFVLEISGKTPLIVTIPDGNYDFLSLQNYLNNFLSTNADYSDIQFLIDQGTPLGTGGSAGSGKMVVGSTTGTLNFSINFVTDQYGNEDKQTPLALKFGWLIGFRNGYYKNTNTSEPTTYISEGIVDLIGPRYIYLVVDDFNNNMLDGFYGTFTSSILNKNILARISLRGSVFNIISQDNFNLITTPRQYFGPVDIQKLQIQLLDEYGRILNLNNMDYSFCLTFKTIYDL